MGEKPEHSASADSQAMKNAKLLSTIFPPPVSYEGISDKMLSPDKNQNFIPLAEMQKRIKALGDTPPPPPPKEAEQVPLSYFANDKPAYSGELPSPVTPPSNPSSTKHHHKR